MRHPVGNHAIEKERVRLRCFGLRPLRGLPPTRYRTPRRILALGRFDREGTPEVARMQRISGSASRNLRIGELVCVEYCSGVISAPFRARG